MFYNFEIKKPSAAPVYILRVEFEQLPSGAFKVKNLTYTLKYYAAWLDLSLQQFKAITAYLESEGEQNLLNRYRVESRTEVSSAEKGISVHVYKGSDFQVDSE